jgi:hypothetical protein
MEAGQLLPSLRRHDKPMSVSAAWAFRRPVRY